MATGHIFFDNSARAVIHRRGFAPAIARSTRSAGLEVQATELNLVEGYSAPEFIADTLIATWRTLLGRDGVLPWIGEILVLEADAFHEGAPQSRIPLNTLDTFDDKESREELCTRLNEFRKRTDASHRDLHAGARPRIQALLKERGLRYDMTDFPRFLDAWHGLDTRLTFAKQTWKDLDLPGPFPQDILTASESWRITSELDALGIFQAAIASRPPRQVQRMDQLQLPYLGGAYRRVFVTRDVTFADAAKMLINGRYNLAQVQTLDEFLNTSGLDDDTT
jgi:hypothetical protein